MHWLLKYLPVLLPVLLICGCGEGPNETAHPLFAKYRKARNDNHYTEAADYLKRYLKVRPESQAAHLELASLYDENLDNPLSAVYHYRCYLETADQHAPQRRDVVKWLETAERRYYNNARVKFNDPEDVASLQDTLHETDQALKVAQAENRRLLQLSNEYSARITKLDHELKLKAIDATDVSILKEQLRDSTASVKQLEVYRDALTREDKSKEQRLAELRKSIEDQNRIIAALRADLAAAEKEAAKIPELLQQYQKLQQDHAGLQKELSDLRKTLTPVNEARNQ